MNVYLMQELEEVVNHKVKRGIYNSASQVIYGDWIERKGNYHDRSQTDGRRNPRGRNRKELSARAGALSQRRDLERLDSGPALERRVPWQRVAFLQSAC